MPRPPGRPLFADCALSATASAAAAARAGCGRAPAIAPTVAGVAAAGAAGGAILSSFFLLLFLQRVGLEACRRPYVAPAPAAGAVPRGSRRTNVARGLRFFCGRGRLQAGFAAACFRGSASTSAADGGGATDTYFSRGTATHNVTAAATAVSGHEPRQPRCACCARARTLESPNSREPSPPPETGSARNPPRATAPCRARRRTTHRRPTPRASRRPGTAPSRPPVAALSAIAAATARPTGPVRARCPRSSLPGSSQLERSGADSLRFTWGPASAGPSGSICRRSSGPASAVTEAKHSASSASVSR